MESERLAGIRLGLGEAGRDNLRLAFKFFILEIVRSILIEFLELNSGF